MTRKIRYLPMVNVLTMVFIGLVTSLAFADVRIGDVLKSPIDYTNSMVELEGVVDETIPDSPGFPKGYYLLRDEFGNSIKVKTEKLPGIGQYIRVRGTVLVPQGEDEPIIIQQSGLWIPPTYILYGIIILATVAVVLLLILILVTVLSRRRPEREMPEVRPPEEAPMEAKADTTPAPKAAETTKLIEPRASISVVEGPSTGESYEITKTDTSIGRADECDVQLPESDTSVSRLHAKVTYVNRQFTVINESRINPMKVNGQEVASKVLEDGDEIQLGATELQFKVHES